jgi:glyoxylase-like metal-dependent hydrolase (beta-lactamase superfamily II)
VKREWRSVAIMGVGVVAVAMGAGVMAQNRDFSQVEIKTDKLTDDLYMLTGAGGNIGVSVGPDGAMLIDDQFAPLSDKIKAAVGKLTDRPIRLLVNTHYHGDHVGGNENFGKDGAVIVAQDNVRKRLATPMVRGQDTIPATPAAGLPVVTFANDLSLHLNGRDIQILHMPRAHTDGDAVIFFQGANVVHMGDTFFNGLYPRIDLQGGGSINGMIAATDAVLKRTDDRTKIIPGHGPLGDRKSLQVFHDMLVGSRDAVAALIKAGKSRDEALAAKPTAKWDETWGKGFMKPDAYAGTIYDDLKK